MVKKIMRETFSSPNSSDFSGTFWRKCAVQKSRLMAEAEGFKSESLTFAEAKRLIDESISFYN